MLRYHTEQHGAYSNTSAWHHWVALHMGLLCYPALLLLPWAARAFRFPPNDHHEEVSCPKIILPAIAQSGLAALSEAVPIIWRHSLALGRFLGAGCHTSGQMRAACGLPGNRNTMYYWQAAPAFDAEFSRPGAPGHVISLSLMLRIALTLPRCCPQFVGHCPTNSPV